MFKLGDIVRLKSGGPDMTVKEVSENSNEYVCRWFSGSRLSQASFEADTVELAKSEITTDDLLGMARMSDAELEDEVIKSACQLSEEAKRKLEHRLAEANKKAPLPG
jgi:uncharacterized protein YodC (DUF2158 family)